MQERPHAPQLPLSVARSVHVLPQVICPPGQAGPVSGAASKPPSLPPVTGGIALTHACRQAICSALSGGRASGIGSPQAVAVADSFCSRYDCEGSPGVTRTAAPQPLAATPSSLGSRPGEKRSRPSAGEFAP
jgi:hypothetical protein